MQNQKLNTDQTYIVYARVSSARQGQSGLGMEAQQATIDRFISQYGGTIIATYSDVMSSKKDRPGLQDAIEHTRLSRGTLLVAKIDRLARSVWMIAQLQREGIPFVVADNPSLDNFTATVYSGLAEKEAELISTRTREALAQAKLRGTRLGSPVLELIRNTDVDNANQVRSESQREFRERVVRIIDQLDSRGFETCKSIADELNRMSLCTYYGKAFTIATVSRLRRQTVQ